MSKLILHLPVRRLLKLKTSKSRSDASVDQKPLIPSLTELKNIRSGNKVSRLFRHIFEHKNIKKLLGSNIAFAIMATSAFPATTPAINLPGTTPVIIKQTQTPLVTNIEGTRLPVKDLRVTQKYWFAHQGVDFDGETGDVVTPIKAGTVISVIYSRVSYGNHVIVDHGKGVTSLYAHFSKILVKEGDHVTIDQSLGLMGSTGRSTGSHLHLEVRENGKSIDPLKVIDLQ